MMKTIIVLLLSIKVAYLFEVNLTNHSSKELVFNGIQYDPIKHPYVVKITIQRGKRQNVCTGSLVKKLYVLTAAHCIYDCNPQDITLKNPFPNVNKFIQIGGHPKDFKNFKAVKCTCIGFGKITRNTSELGSSGLMMTTTVTYGRNACELYYTDLIKPHWEEYLCSKAGRITMTCPGDSGGPMICNDKLYGVCSFGYNYEGGEDICGGTGVQTVHTFLHFHLRWINNIINSGAKKKNSGHSLKQHQLHTILAIALYSLLLV